MGANLNPSLDQDLKSVLDQLKDIHYPNDIYWDVSLWWPPAPGISLLLIIISLLIFYSIYKAIKYIYSCYISYSHSKARFQALNKLSHIEQQIDQNHPIATLQQISILLKQCAVTIEQNDNKLISHLSGKEWLEYLDSTLQKKHTNINTALSNNTFIHGPGKLLISYAYSNPEHDYKIDITEIKKLIKLSKKWIKNNIK